MKARLGALAALVLLLGSLTAVPASAASPVTSGVTDAGSCAVTTNVDGTISVTCGPGQSWPTDPSIGQCFDKKLQADGVTVVVTCEPVGVEPPTPVPPTPVPSPTPCGVSVNADGTISVTCGLGQSWPNDPSIGQCFDKKLQPDGVTVVVTCEPVGVEPPTPVPPTPVPSPTPCGVTTNADGTLAVTCGPGQSWPTDPSIGQCFDKKLQADGVTVVVLCLQAGDVAATPPPVPTKVVPKPAPVTQTAAQKLAAKKAAAKKLAAKKLAAKKLAAKKLAAKKLAAKKAAAKRAAVRR